ncbi:MAG: pilus assembly FimT family protein [Candidatus Aminicenantaceae bacterium]
MKNRKGFTLSETMVCLFILAVIINLASTSFLSLAPKYRLKKAVWAINSSLNYARYKAIYNGIKYRLKCYSRKYLVEKYDKKQKDWKRDYSAFLEGITLKATNTPTFHPRGTVSNLASIYISNSSGKYKISVAISGRIKTSKL